MARDKVFPGAIWTVSEAPWVRAFPQIDFRLENREAVRERATGLDIICENFIAVPITYYYIHNTLMIILQQNE